LKTRDLYTMQHADAILISSQITLYTSSITEKMSNLVSCSPIQSIWVGSAKD
jgi:cellobiose-specific phosphotransferase system component IIB